MHGTGRSWVSGLTGTAARGTPNHSQLIATASALVAELSTTLALLGAMIVEPVAVPVAEVRALSTKEAAKRLGVTPYTLADRVRRGELQARQDAKGGPYHFDAAELERYSALKQTGRLADRIAGPYIPGHDKLGITQAPAGAGHDTTRARRGGRRHNDHGRPVGTRRAPDKPGRSVCTLAPGLGAWGNDPPDDPEG